MGIWEEFQAYVQANTPRNTRPAISPAKVIDHGLLGGRIGQMPQRAQSMHEGLLGAPAELKQLTSPEFKRKLDEQLKQPAAIDRDKMVSMGMDLLQTTVPLGGLIGHTVYHGSPHKFDKFDMSKIGTGEGAQAYGHGLYFAESPGVAKSYSDKLAAFGGNDPWWKDMVRQRMAAGDSFDDALKRVAGKDQALYSEMSKIGIDDYAKPEGYMYKVDIPDESIPRMLDWDKPLSEQAPEVLQAISNKTGVPVEKYLADNRPGKKMWEVFVNRRGSVDEASTYLKEMGIPGIRYLDGSSRKTGKGTSNYVLFDDALARILEVNGNPTGLLSWADEAKRAKKK